MYSDNELGLGLFNLIQGFNIENKANVSTVSGKNAQQTAYRLSRNTNLRSKIENIFPYGMPQKFSFGILFRQITESVEPWNLFQVTDEKGTHHLSITINPLLELIELNVIDDNKEMKNYQFKLPKVQYKILY